MVTITTGLESSGERNIECPCGRFEKKTRGKCRYKKSKYITWGMEKVRNVLPAREKEREMIELKRTEKPSSTICPGPVILEKRR